MITFLYYPGIDIGKHKYSLQQQCFEV